jgi:hypothetical protein
MRTQTGWHDTKTGKPLRKLTCSAYVDEAEYQKILKIAKKQGWEHLDDIGRYIMENGWEVFVTHFYSGGEVYDEEGNLIDTEPIPPAGARA